MFIGFGQSGLCLLGVIRRSSMKGCLNMNMGAKRQMLEPDVSLTIQMSHVLKVD